MKKTVSVFMALLAMIILLAGCKNISDNAGGKIEPPSSALPQEDDSPDGSVLPESTIMPELVPSKDSEPSASPAGTSSSGMESPSILPCLLYTSRCV